MAEWLILLTPTDRPFRLMRRDGDRLTPAPPPRELMEHVERAHGAFDTESVWDDQGIGGAYIEWPPPEPPAARRGIRFENL